MLFAIKIIFVLVEIAFMAQPITFSFVVLR
jgi:hypothetical protein